MIIAIGLILINILKVLFVIQKKYKKVFINISNAKDRLYT